MEINYSERALRELRKLPKADRDKVIALIESIPGWPNDDSRIIQLSGRSDFRIKKGWYRAIFEATEIENDEWELYITHCGLRDEKTYKG